MNTNLDKLFKELRKERHRHKETIDEILERIRRLTDDSKSNH